MNVTGVEFFDQLSELHQQPNSISDKYPKLRSLLERVCKDMTAGDTIQFSNLFSRLNYVCKKTKLPPRRTYQVNTFRVNANNVLFAGFNPSEEDYLQDLKALCNAVSHFYAVPIPAYIADVLPEIELYKPTRKIEGEKHARLRVEVVDYDEDYIYAFAEKMPTEDPIKIRYGIKNINEEFDETISALWPDCQLNLIDVTIDKNGILYPELIILEPDYLIDISALAECLKEYGSHPLNYIQSRFEGTKNTKHILLGNAANIFLDEFVNEKPHEPVIYKSAMLKAFKNAPLEFATCTDLNSKENEYEFFESAKTQFNNIQRVVNNFLQKGIDREYGILEPAFMCEHLGVQGRLDYLQLNAKSQKQIVIELKSGKAPSPDNDFTLIGRNHEAQAFIYQIIIQKILGVAFNNLDTIILYSKYSDEQANLRLSVPVMVAIRKILNMRNLIVASERNIASDTTGEATKDQIDSISPETLITNTQLSPHFLSRFIVPQINHFKSFFSNSSPLEKAYFHNFYAFVAREHYISKTGGADYEGSKGISSLWLSTLDEKIEAGEILTDLTISENNTESITPTVTLKIPAYEDNFLPNFRQGDIVILYQRNNQDDNVTNKQIFKGTIETLNHEEIRIRLRQRQRNQSVLPPISLYAVEHDFMDATYSTMYRGLYAFLQANTERRALLLNQRKPLLGAPSVVGTKHSEEIIEVVQKAKQARDYFLLVGPPGTGKTSIALKEMVKEFYHLPGGAILLLSFTNRAVDEICDSLDAIEDKPEYIRIGSSLSCSARHKDRLLNNVIEDCDSRERVKLRVQQYRIFVGTVASVSARMDLFRIRHFQVAIVDEASQILEPHLLGILAAKHGNGNNAIDKFILIGDHKQLPAVVLQKPIASQVNDPSLKAIGLHDSRNSLFERLFNLHKDDRSSPFWSMLHKQGRMHPAIAFFPNYAFYNGELQVVPCAHQTAELEFHTYASGNAVQELIATKRLAFIPSGKSENEKTNKTNSHEACITAILLKNIYALYELNGLSFKPGDTVGVITPYRSQIALIRREIAKLDIPALNQITIDTVERFQGSQRDIIIYSFSVNQFYQIDLLSNNMEDNGMLVDRKLNVALTRAKKQLFITGNPAILSNNLTYFRLIEFIRSKDGYLPVRPSQFLSENFVIQKQAVPPQPDKLFTPVFNNLVIAPIKKHPATRPPAAIYGNDHDYNKLCVIEYGRTNFDKPTFTYTAKEKVDLYCYYNMRQQYCTALEMFESSADYFRKVFISTGNRISFIDLGCGPLTSGLAFNRCFSVPFHYIGIDMANAMLDKANEFAGSGLFNRDTTFLLKQSLEDIDQEYWSSTFLLSNTVILNFSYQFANLGKEDVEHLALSVNRLLDKYPLNRYIVSATDRKERMYHIFRRLVPRLNDQ